MSEKKCKVCGAPAEWQWDGEFYCENCIRTEFDVQWNDAPHACEMCGEPLDIKYYTEVEGYTFCSAKCALEFHGVCELGEERDDE